MLLKTILLVFCIRILVLEGVSELADHGIDDLLSVLDDDLLSLFNEPLGDRQRLGFLDDGNWAVGLVGDVLENISILVVLEKSIGHSVRVVNVVLVRGDHDLGIDSDLLGIVSEGSVVSGEAGAAEPVARLQALGPDARILSDSAENLELVRTWCRVGDVGDLVAVGDLHRDEAVDGELCDLGALGLHAADTGLVFRHVLVSLLEPSAGLPASFSDQNHVGPEESANDIPLRDEFWIVAQGRVLAVLQQVATDGVDITRNDCAADDNVLVGDFSLVLLGRLLSGKVLFYLNK